MSRVGRSLVSLALAAFAAAPAFAQQSIHDRIGARVPANVLAALDSAAALAAARGLPTEPLVQKVLEGAAKGVPAERVIAAVQALVARLAMSADALVQGGLAAPDADAIQAGEFALTAGLAEGDIGTLTRVSVAPYSPAATLRVAATLVAVGVPAAQAVELIEAQIAAGRSPAELTALPGSVQMQMARGVTPAQAARGLTRAAASGQGGRPPAAPGRPADRPGRRPLHP